MGDTEGPRRTRHGQERKQQLLDCAAMLFAEHGYGATRVVDICRAAGVAKGLFYWYFENKEALFRELVDTIRDRLRRTQDECIDHRAPPLARVRQGVEASIRFVGEQRRLYSLFEIDQPDPQLARALRRGAEVHVADTARHISAGIATGDIRDDDPELLAQAVVGMVAFLSHQHRLGAIELTIDELAVFAGRLIVHSLAATDRAATEALDHGLGANRTEDWPLSLDGAPAAAAT